MAYSQVRPPVMTPPWQQAQTPRVDPNAGYSATSQPGYSVVTDRNNPQARSYALSRLHAAVAAGHLPRFDPAWNKDPAAAWRGVSSLMAQAGIFSQGTPGEREQDVRGAAQAQPPANAVDERVGMFPTSNPAQTGTTESPGFTLPGPSRAYPMGPGENRVSAIGRNEDWRGRIGQMAQALHGQLHTEAAFQHNQKGPAEAAFTRMAHINDVHTASAKLAELIGHSRNARARQA